MAVEMTSTFLLNRAVFPPFGIAAAWGRDGISCNAIAPAIGTPMYEEARARMDAEALARHDADQAKKRIIGGKPGDPVRDVLPMMTFLVSDGANCLTGQTCKIDGGGLMLS